MKHYWEMVFTAGPGTICHHAVTSDQSENLFALEMKNGRVGVSILVECISTERYLEFITIHGSEVAI